MTVLFRLKPRQQQRKEIPDTLIRYVSQSMLFEHLFVYLCPDTTQVLIYRSEKVNLKMWKLMLLVAFMYGVPCSVRIFSAKGVCDDDDY